MDNNSYHIKESELKEVADELLKKYNIRTDRYLIKKLNLNDEQKAMFLTWVKYQGIYEYRAGFRDGQEDLRSDIKEILHIN